MASPAGAALRIASVLLAAPPGGRGAPLQHQHLHADTHATCTSMWWLVAPPPRPKHTFQGPAHPTLSFRRPFICYACLSAHSSSLAFSSANFEHRQINQCLGQLRGKIVAGGQIMQCWGKAESWERCSLGGTKGSRWRHEQPSGA